MFEFRRNHVFWCFFSRSPSWPFCSSFSFHELLVKCLCQVAKERRVLQIMAIAMVSCGRQACGHWELTGCSTQRHESGGVPTKLFCNCDDYKIIRTLWQNHTVTGRGWQAGRGKITVACLQDVGAEYGYITCQKCELNLPPIARALPLSDVHAEQELDSCRWNVAVAAKRLLEAPRLG